MLWNMIPELNAQLNSAMTSPIRFAYWICVLYINANMETQKIQIQNTKYTKYSINKLENIQKIEFGNTKDGSIFTSPVPLIYKIWNTNTKYEINNRQNIQKNRIWKHKRWKYFHKLSPSYLWGLLHKAPGENPH